MEYPQNNIWGPHLWLILHSLAERIGSKHHPRIPMEETHVWNGLLSSLRYSLPCPKCKKHYSNYYLSNPISSIAEIRLWLYNLHSRVNDITGKQSITIEQLSELYSKDFNFSYHYSFIFEQMNNALRVGWCSRNDIQRTFRFLNEIQLFYELV